MGAKHLLGQTLGFGESKAKVAIKKDVILTNEANKLLKTKGNCKKTNPNEPKNPISY